MLPPSSTIFGLERTHFEPLCKKCWHPVVVAPIVVFRPAVENPIGDARLRPSGIAHKDRTIIARPASIRAMAKELDGVPCSRRIWRARAVRFFQPRHLPPESGPSPLAPGAGQCRHKPKESARISPANRCARAAMPAKWLRAAPIRPACETRVFAGVNPATAAEWGRRRPCGGPAGTANCAGLLRCGADRIRQPESLRREQDASAITCPNGSAINEEPQNSRPRSGGPS